LVKLKPLDKQTLAYIAGLVDGEGCISLHGRNGDGSTQVIFNIANTFLPLHKWLKRTLGVGNYYIHNRNVCNTWKVAYNYSFSKEATEVLLPLLYPYLFIKKRQAKVLLDYLKVLKTTKVKTPERIRKVDACIDKIRKLNKRGR